MSSVFNLPKAEELRNNLERLRELILKSAEMPISRFLPDDPDFFKDPEKLSRFIEDQEPDKLEDWEEEKVDLLYKVGPFIPVRLPEEVINKLVEMDAQVKSQEDEIKLQSEIQFQHIETIIARILAIETEAEWEEFLETAEEIRKNDEENPPVFA
jgi:hypothetical protein